MARDMSHRCSEKLRDTCLTGALRDCETRLTSPKSQIILAYCDKHHKRYLLRCSQLHYALASTDKCNDLTSSTVVLGGY